MSKSFKISNGDLSVGVALSYETVSGRNKLTQDLRLWILEQLGIDPSTPSYGSRLDGSIINGAYSSGFIGEMMTIEKLLEIRSEIASIIQQYQQVQLDRIQRDSIDFQGQQTQDPDEVLYRIDSIDVKPLGDSALARVVCQTLAKNTIRIIIPVQV